MQIMKMINFNHYKKVLLCFSIFCISYIIIESIGKDVATHLLNPLKTEELKINKLNFLGEFSFTCSEEVTNLGFHQKVISYSFLNNSKRYWIGFNELMQNISVFYPGWRVRVYASSPDISFLQSIMGNWTFVNFCDIDNLPPPIYSVRSYPVTMWRFAPLGDDQVDVMLSRDLDSEILKREYDAVSEWLNSTNKSLHIMRDHQFHFLIMLGGTWGIRVTKRSERRRLRIIRQEMFKRAFNRTNTMVDQTYLAEILWPEFKTNFIAHDSFCCDYFSGSSPFPTRREDGKYVGAPIFGSENPSRVRNFAECPSECRPENHKDWKYC